MKIEKIKELLKSESIEEFVMSVNERIILGEI